MMLAVWDLTDSPIATAIKVIFNNSRDKRFIGLETQIHALFQMDERAPGLGR